MQVLGALLLTLFSLFVHTNAFPILDKLRALMSRDNLCNGNAALCSRKYSDVTFIGTHDSAFVGDLPSQDQIKSLSDQLKGGIRFLQSQTHKMTLGDLSVMAMCHTDCAIPGAFGGLVEDYLKTVKSFLDANPREVVTLLLTNPDGASMTDFQTLFANIGLDKMAFVPAGSPNTLPMGDWPTLGDMIAKNQRLVTFIDYGADTTKVPYLLDEFNYFWEGPFDTTNPSFPQCDMDRKNKIDASGKSTMFLINHYLDIEIPFVNILIPYKDKAGQTNAVTGTGSIGAQADLCKAKWGRNPNVMLIDFFGEGDAIGAQNRANGL